MADRQEFFTPLDFDFLWEAFGAGELPYPLSVPSHGGTEDERIAARRAAHAEFQRRFHDHTGRFDPFIQESIGLLGRSTLSIDALHIPEFEQSPVGILAASDGARAVVAIQDREGIRLRSALAEALVSTVVDLLPTAQRGQEASLTLPLDEAVQTAPAPAMAEVGSSSADLTKSKDALKSKLFNFGKAASPGRSPRSRPSLSDQLADPVQSYARLAGQPRLRGGQLAVNSRNSLGSRRRSEVLAWFDTKTGRYLSLARTGADGRVWITVSPADSMTLRTRLAEMVQAVS